MIMDVIVSGTGSIAFMGFVSYMLHCTNTYTSTELFSFLVKPK